MPLFDTEKKAKRQGLSLNPNQRWIDKGWEALEGQDLRVQPNEEQLIALGKGGAGAEEHGMAGELAAGLGRGALRVAATPAYLADVAGEAVGWKGLEKAGEYGAEKVEQYIEESPRLRKSASISGDIRDNPQLWTDPKWYLSIIGEGAPTIASMIVPGMAAARVAKVAGMGVKGIQAARMGGALTAGMGLEAGGSAEDIRQYEKRTGKQVSISKKLQTVVGTGIVAGSLEAVPVFNLFGKAVAKKLIGRIITSMALEGSTEGAQEIVANAFAKAGYDADRDMVGGVIESVVGGVLLGGGMGAMQQTFQERIKNTDHDKVSDILEQAEKETTQSLSEATDLISNIDESMSTGKIINTDQDFTPEIAMGIIKQSYEDKILSDADLESLGEKHPELKNDIIGVKIASKISIEVQDAEKVRREVEKAGIKERAEYLKRAGLPKGKPFTTEVEPLETARAKFFEAPTTKKEAADKARAKFFAAKLPGTISTEARAKKDEVDRKWKELIARKPFIPQKDISDKEYKEFWSEELDKAEYLRQSPEGLDALRKQLEAEEEAGNVQPEYAEWWRTKLDRMEQIRQSVTGKELLAKELAEAEGLPVTPKVEPEAKKEPVTPKPEIPELQDTTQAKEFGKTATPEQISRLKELRQESLDKSKALKEQGKLEEAFAEVQSGQFYREAIQEAEMPVEEVAAEKEITFVEFEKQYKNAFKEMMKYPPNQVGSNVWSDKMAELSDAHPEWAEKIEDETAKPQPSKLEKQKPSEATGMEIKAKAIPRVAPKKPTPKVKEEKVEVTPEKELTFKDYQEKITKDLKGKKLSASQLIEYAEKEKLSYFGWVQTAYESLSPKTAEDLKKEIATLERRKSKIKRDVTSRAQATTREANLGKIQGSIDAKQEALRALEIEVAPKEQASKVRTLRGEIKRLGGINFLNFTGELKDMPTAVKYLSKKTGMGIDVLEMDLKESGWIGKDETLLELLKNPESLKRNKISAEILEKPASELTESEKRLKEEMDYQPEAPPEGEYITINAEDLPVGKKMTLLEDKTSAGWDIYEVTEKDSFEITLKDGIEVTLSPLDKVQVLKKDVKKTEEIEVISPDGTYVNREKTKETEKDGLKATYYGVYRKDGAFKAWKTKAEIDKIKKAEGKVELDLRQEYYGKQAKVTPTDKMKQRGLGLEVEDKEQPGLFKKPAVEVPKAEYGVPAYHGGPHAFTKFEASKIGTGEGAQAFGYGLYFTSEENIAKGYADLGKEGLSINGVSLTIDDTMADYRKALMGVEKISPKTLRKTLDIISDGLANYTLSEIKKNPSISGYTVSENEATAVRAVIENNKITTSRNLYKVTLHKGKDPSEYTWLDWDKPLKDQRSKAQQAIKEALDDYQKQKGASDRYMDIEFRNANISKIYQELSSIRGQKEASLFLLRAGIDGIKYPSGTISGMAKEGAYNYVVFDEGAVTIEEHTVYANKEAYGSQEKADAAIESVAEGISDKRMPDRGRVEESEVVKELRTKKRVDFTGRKLTAGNESQEIAELFQVYRSPKLEILHTIYTSEDGTILGHNAMTSGQIDYVSPGDMAKYMHGMKSAAKRLGATKVHVLHNHPSGNETMSQMDVNFAARISNNLGTQMGEFIVIDHGKFTRIQQAKNDAVWVDTGEFKMPEGIKDWTAGKVKISNEIQMAQFGASLAYDKNKAIFVYLGNQNEVQGWTIHDKKILTKGNIALKNSIQQQIKAHDATKAVLIADSPVLLKRIVVGRAVGDWLVDVQDVKGNSLRAEYPNSFSVGREFAKKAWGLFEPKPKYATKPTIDYKELLKRYAASKERTNTTNQTAEQDGSKYKGSSETGQASIENIMTNLRKVSKSDAVKYNIEKEQKIIKEYRKLEVLAKDSQASVASKQKMLAAFLKVLPTNVRAKVITPLTFISRYKEVKTHQKRIDEALYVTEKELSFYLRRSIMSDIAKGVKPKKLAKNRIKKDTIGHEAARDLQFIRDTLQEKDIASRITQLESQLVAKESELEEADESRMEIIEEQISDLQSHISIVETFGNIKSQALDDLIFAKEAISSIILEGRALWRLQRDAFKETLNPMITKVQQDISGQEEPTLETSAEATKRAVEKESILGKAKGTWDAVENSILSWEFLMNKLSKLSNSKIMQSYTTTEMGSIAQSATKQENILNSETDEFIHSNAKRIFNVETNNALNKKFIKQEVKQTGKVFSYKDGKQVDDFAISQMEAAYMYAIRKNQDSMPTFDKMGMTDKTFQEIEAFIGTELKTWVDFNVDEYLQDFHFSVNKVYRQVYGTNLTKTPGYISWYRDVPGKVQEKGIAASPHETGAKGMSKGAFKERVKNTNPYRFMSFNDVLTRHISEMNNFKAWAMPTKVISGVFNNRKTQRLIIQNHSANIRNAIKSFQTDFTKSPLEMRGEMAWLDKMRGNITTAMTALNPTIFLKQLTSIPAMAESIPTNEWIKYSVDFWANPLKAWRLLKESKHWESRRKRGMERDIRTAQAVSGSQAVANVRNLKNRAMFLVKWGDGAAILVGGYPVYKYHFDNNVKKVGKDKAHEFALEKFEEAMDRTQQASGIKDQGKFQRSGSYAKLFSMFLTAPKQYTSQITAAIRQIHSNPKDGDAYKRLFIFGVMMPSLFQATASGLIGLIGGDDDDEKKFISDQIKAILQSPLNGIPIIRDLQKGVWESAMGEWYGTNVDYSPVTSAGQSLMSAVFHGAKLFSDDAEKRDKHIEEAVNNVFETAGYAYGLPVETVRKMFMENWADIVTGKTDYPVRRALGFSRHATNEQDSKFTKEKRRLKKIKDEYVESKNKAAFRSEHFKDLRDYNRMNKLQGRLNKYRKKINRIKSRPETRESKVRIQRLEEIRTGLIKNYLGKR